MSVKPIPDGFHTITPYLTVKDAKKAIEFYQKAFGASVISVMNGDENQVMHAEIKIGDSIVMLADEWPSCGVLGPQSLGGSSGSLLIYTKDVDADFDRAIKAGCTSIFPVTDQFWGDRYGKLSDPFGHVWSLATHIEDVSDEEMEKRRLEMVKQMKVSAPN